MLAGEVDVADDDERRAGRVLRFAVTGALLAAPLSGCGDGAPVEVNEPAPEQPTINEPASPDPEPVAEPPEPRGPTPNLPAPTDEETPSPEPPEAE